MSQRIFIQTSPNSWSTGITGIDVLRVGRLWYVVSPTDNPHQFDHQRKAFNEARSLHAAALEFMAVKDDLARCRRQLELSETSPHRMLAPIDDGRPDDPLRDAKQAAKIKQHLPRGILSMMADQR